MHTVDTDGQCSSLTGVATFLLRLLARACSFLMGFLSDQLSQVTFTKGLCPRVLRLGGALKFNIVASFLRLVLAASPWAS
jgi:hypothetical protein